MNRIETYLDKGETVTDIFSDGEKEILVYFKGDKVCHTLGRHKGRITGKRISGEFLNAKTDASARLLALKVKVPEKLAKQFDPDNTLLDSKIEIVDKEEKPGDVSDTVSSIEKERK